ncbi:DnaJ protein, putative [Plasmodium reichenowi]|uniref:DnaJ protein, putative n=1 Tax=Plasmodium reichenowi TaxID=5854 RepID=A0A060RRT4_PLARE|nr:DnaJ protein, putative [Plasmodium reichenowi]
MFDYYKNKYKKGCLPYFLVIEVFSVIILGFIYVTFLDTSALIGNSFIATDFFDRCGRYLYATERFNEIFGIPSKDVLRSRPKIERYEEEEDVILINRFVDEDEYNAFLYIKNLMKDLKKYKLWNNYSVIPHVNEYNIVNKNEIDERIDNEIDTIKRFSKSNKNIMYNLWFKVMNNEKMKYYSLINILKKTYKELKILYKIPKNLRKRRRNKYNNIIYIYGDFMELMLNEMFEDWFNEGDFFLDEFKLLINSNRIAWKALMNHVQCFCKNIMTEGLEEVIRKKNEKRSSNNINKSSEKRKRRNRNENTKCAKKENIDNYKEKIFLLKYNQYLSFNYKDSVDIEQNMDEKEKRFKVKRKKHKKGKLRGTHMENENMKECMKHKEKNLNETLLNNPDLYKSESNNIKSDNIKSKNIKSKNIKSSDIQSKNIKSSDIQSKNIKSSDIQSNNIQSNNIQSNNIQSNNIQSNNIQSNNIQSNYIQSRKSRNLEEAEIIFSSETRFNNYNKKKVYYLDEEAHELFSNKNCKQKDNNNDNAYGGCSRSRSSCVDTKYYDILNVKPYASFKEIKDSFYKLALKYHPDKNENNIEAKIMFQKINEAYQILSDEDQRRKYDEGELDEVNDSFFMDPLIFFMMLFTSEELFDYIGTLRIATFVGLVFKHNFFANGILTTKNIINKGIEKEQKKREVELAILLRERLQPYVDGNENWGENMENEIQKLFVSPFACSILESIGWTYENVSKGYIDEITNKWGIGLSFVNIKLAYRTVRAVYSHVKSFFNIIFTVKKLKRAYEIMDSIIDAKDVHEPISNKSNSMICDSEGSCDYNVITPDNINKDTMSNNFNNNLSEHENNRKNVSEACSIISKNNNINDLNDNNCPITYEEKNKILKSFIIELLTVILYDIETTVRNASDKFLRDQGVDVYTRLKRAEGMRILGKLMQKWVKTKKNDQDINKFDFINHTKNAFDKASCVDVDEDN